jgi:hypothetical protein
MIEKLFRLNRIFFKKKLMKHKQLNKNFIMISFNKDN